AFQRQTSKAYPVYPTTVLSQSRQLGRDSTNVTARAIQVTIHDSDTIGINTLVVYVTVIQQGYIFVHLDGLAHVFRHVGNRSQLGEILLLSRLDNRLTEPEKRVHLVGTRAINGGLLTINGSVIVKHVLPHCVMFSIAFIKSSSDALASLLSSLTLGA